MKNEIQLPGKAIHHLRKETHEIKTKEDAERVLRKVNPWLKKVNYSKDKFNLRELNEIKNKAELKLKELSPQSSQSTKPWYRRFYFGDEHLHDIFKEYDEIKNQESRYLSFGSINKINELRQKIKSIIKRTKYTKLVNRLKKMSHRLKQKLIKKQRYDNIY